MNGGSLVPTVVITAGTIATIVTLAGFLAGIGR